MTSNQPPDFTAFWRAMRCTPRASTTDNTAGRPSGCAGLEAEAGLSAVATATTAPMPTIAAPTHSAGTRPPTKPSALP